MTFELRKRYDGVLLLIDRQEDHVRVWGTYSDGETITDKELKDLGAISGISTWGTNAELLWKEGR